MSEISRQELKARNTLLTILIVYVLLDILTVIAEQDYMIGAFRITSTIFLIWFLMAGYKWAKWFSVVLFSGASITCLGFGAILLTENAIWSAAFALFGAGCLGVAVYIIRSTNLNRYFDTVRLQRSL